MTRTRLPASPKSSVWHLGLLFSVDFIHKHGKEIWGPVPHTVLSKTMEISNSSDKVLWRFSEVVLFFSGCSSQYVLHHLFPSYCVITRPYILLWSMCKETLLRRQRVKQTRRRWLIAISKQLVLFNFSRRTKGKHYWYDYWGIAYLKHERFIFLQ